MAWRKQQILNLIIVGVGGQGVASLLKVIQKLCIAADLSAQSSLLKGGAQRLGTVTGQIRIFLNRDLDHFNFSPTIPAGRCDFLIGLEPWEALRMHDRLSADSAVLVNSQETPFESNRGSRREQADPAKLFLIAPEQIHIHDFTDQSRQRFANNVMVNYLMGEFFIAHLFPLFSATDFTKTFVQTVPRSAPQLQSLT